MTARCPKCQTDNPDTQKFCGECATPLKPIKGIGVTKTLETPVEEYPRGSTFADRYKIIEKLGTGGMGAVYRVEDTNIGQDVALKLIKPDIASDKKTIERFRNELKTTRMISHRNVCRMFDLAEAEATYYITMEYVPGEDLRSFIRRSGKLDIPKAISIAKEICEGLDEAHRLGVVHRDLKSSNIMIDKEGNARIMDFGIARSLRAKGLTGEGIIIGTPEYMSPEQAEAKVVDQRSDIYSLGVILYEMVTGQLPFEGDTPLSVAMKHKSEIPIDPKKSNPQIPNDLSKLILKCMGKDKEKRYQSADEVRSELTNIEKGIPTTDRVIPKRKPLTSREITLKLSLKKPLIPALVIGILVIAVMIVIWWPWSQKALVMASKIENSIAVISFKNQTGDRTYDYLQEAIPNLLITSLERGGAHYVMTWERMRDLLKQIGEENVVEINSDLGFKVCQLEGVGAIVVGHVVKAGEIFATDVKVLDVETKKIIKSASSKGEGEGSILKTQIDELSREISLSLGVADPEGEKSELGIADVTTTSMEAYTFYLKGREAEDKVYYEDARNFYAKAVEFDPNFATALRCLGYVEGILGNRNARIEAYEKAMSLIDTATEKERSWIEARYASSIERNYKKSAEILHELAEKYPKEKLVQMELGYYYFQVRRQLDIASEHYKKVLELDPNHIASINQLGYINLEKEDYDKALEYFKKYRSAAPQDANPYDSLAEAYFYRGDLDESINNYLKAISIKPDFWISFTKLGYAYAMQEDYANAVRRIDQSLAAAQSPGRKMYSHLWRAFMRFWLGRYKDTYVELEQGLALAKEMKNLSRETYINYLMGLISYGSKHYDILLKCQKNLIDIYQANYPKRVQPTRAAYQLMLGLVDVRKGDMVSAKGKLNEAKSLRPEYELNLDKGQNYYYCLLYGEIALAEKKPDEVITVFGKRFSDRVIMFDSLGSLYMIQVNLTLGMDILARAYLHKKELDKAIDEYLRLLTFDPERKSRLLFNPIFHYRIADVYEKKGLIDEAIEHYEKFLTLWKDADAGMVEVEDARERLARLKAESP